MTTIIQSEDITTVRPPAGAKEGDAVEVKDADGNVRLVRLRLPMGEEFTFAWEDPPKPSTDASFVKNDAGDWLIRVEGEHKPGDLVTVTSRNGRQEHRLGEPAGDGLYRLQKRNRFKRNPAGDDPKWCVQVAESHKAGDIVDVTKSDQSTQRHQLIREVQQDVWTTKKV